MYFLCNVLRMLLYFVSHQNLQFFVEQKKNVVFLFEEQKQF